MEWHHIAPKCIPCEKMNKKHFHQKAHLFRCAFPLILLSHKEHIANLTTAELSLEGNQLAVEEPTLFHIPHVVTTPAPRNSKTKHDLQTTVSLHCSQLIIQRFCSKAIFPFKQVFTTQRQTLCVVCANYSHHLGQGSSSQHQDKELCQRRGVQRAQSTTLARQRVLNPVLKSPEQSCLAPSMWTVLQGHEDHSLDPTLVSACL